jgi:glycosyltransferase involved in cell wall biosynthesis
MSPATSVDASAPQLRPLPAHSGSSALPHLVHILPSFGIGGQQIRLAQLVNRLAGKYRHTVVPLDGVTTARALIERTEDFAVHPWTAPKHRFPRPRLLRRSCAFLKDLDAAVLLTYNWGAADWALANRLWLGLPHLHFEDGFGADESLARQLRRRVLYRRLALGGPMSRIVVPSQQLHRLATEVWRFAPGKVLHIPNGIDCDLFRAAPDPGLAARVARRRDEVIVGTVAALRPEKNLPRLLRAFAAVSQATVTRLVIAGDGPERSRLEALVRDSALDERVIFLGPVSGAQQVLGLFDSFALSSDTEQMPYSVLEGMAAGLPIVSTDVGDIHLMVAERNREFIVPATDEPGFARALATLVGNSHLRDALGKLNAERVRRTYDMDTMAAKYDELLGATVDRDN